MLSFYSESVRSLWSAQQQELIFFGNENAERGSIQQMQSAVRNLITQACDLPVGYPIYISDLVSSYGAGGEVMGAMRRAGGAMAAAFQRRKGAA